MGILRRSVLIAGASLALAAPTAFPAQQKNEKDAKSQDSQRPKLTLHAQPPVGTTPARIVLTAEMIGGANDFEEYYCPTIEWDWDDGTRSESTIDCEPYQPGKSEIKRRFTVEHVFRRPGAFKVFFRLKRRDKTLAATSANVQVRPGGPQYFEN
jgi:hypothetical protein